MQSMKGSVLEIRITVIIAQQIVVLSHWSSRIHCQFFSHCKSIGDNKYQWTNISAIIMYYSSCNNFLKHIYRIGCLDCWNHVHILLSALVSRLDSASFLQEFNHIFIWNLKPAAQLNQSCYWPTVSTAYWQFSYCLSHWGNYSWCGIYWSVQMLYI